MSDQESDNYISIVKQLRSNLDEFISTKIISIKYNLLAASAVGRLSVEYEFGQSIDESVVDEIIQSLLDEGLNVVYVSTESDANSLYKISWDRQEAP